MDVSTGALVFGGCCTNAWALEQATTRNPQAGSLLTFLQYSIITIIGLWKHVEVRSWSIRLKPRVIPLRRWIIQVALFFLVSWLNNSAFAYAIPMSVHIVFRSGGLVSNMLVGQFVDGKRYSQRQVFCVLIVTLGVALTTSSASSSFGTSSTAIREYYKGIAILTVALLLSGFLGLAQDRTQRIYGYGHADESVFYLHALGMPFFALIAPDVQAQWNIVTTQPDRHIPYISVATITMVFCATGANRLAARVSSLTTTLVLAVRKAVSVLISVLLVNRNPGNAPLWSGAALVLAGTVLYATERKEKKRE